MTIPLYTHIYRQFEERKLKFVSLHYNQEFRSSTPSQSVARLEVKVKKNGY